MTAPRVIRDSLGFGESPRWHDGRLWLCNWGTQQVLAIDDAGRSEVMATVSTTPNTLPFSIDWLPDGRLLIVSGPEAVVLRQEPGGDLVTHADLSGLDGLFNEIVVSADGTAYVNGMSIVRIRPDGSAEQVATELAFGNGMAITPDGATLIVAESYGRRLTAFDIDPDGSLSGRRVWAELGTGCPDGICLDDEGAVWYADVPNQCCALVREGGTEIRRVAVDRGCFACMLGGADGRTLFIAAAQWRGWEHRFEPGQTGLLLATDVEVGHAGRP